MLGMHSRTDTENECGERHTIRRIWGQALGCDRNRCPIGPRVYAAEDGRVCRAILAAGRCCANLRPFGVNGIPQILCCDCSQARLLQSEVRAAVKQCLASAGVEFLAVKDLCGLTARRDPLLQNFAQGNPLAVVACYPRAVRWLFSAADAPLPENDVVILNLRTLSVGEAVETARRLAGAIAVQQTPRTTGIGTANSNPDAWNPADWPPWFPVIDYSRCSNCHQCLSFCLFGVYGLDKDNRVRVSNPTACKTNCPACARVCPQAAIIFPKYKSPPINGDEVSPEDIKRESMKTDIAALLREDVYSALRARNQRNRTRFALEFDADKAAMERCKCAAQSSEHHKALLAALTSIPNVNRTMPDTNNTSKEPGPTMQFQTILESQRQATTTEPTDLELVAKAKAGDLSAFETLVTRHERRIYSLAFRILQHQQDAEDVTQQTFLSALEHLSGFREEASFATWLSRIATHAALKVIRKRHATETHVDENPHAEEEERGPLPHPEFIADWSQSPEHLAQQNETRQLIEQALQELDDKHRLVFILRDVEGLSVKDTAATLGISEVNVKVRLMRARLRLRERLTRAFGDPARRLAPHKHDGDDMDA